MVSLQSKFRQELDGINFIVQQLNRKELGMGMTKISHLENTVCALDKGIREIKHPLLVKGNKTPVSSSVLVNDSSPSEALSWQPLDEVGRPSHIEPQPMAWVLEHFPRCLELPIFEGNDLDGWILLEGCWVLEIKWRISPRPYNNKSIDLRYHEK